MSAECARLAVDLERLLPKVDADDLDEDRRVAFAQAALAKIAALEAAANGDSTVLAQVATYEEAMLAVIEGLRPPEEEVAPEAPAVAAPAAAPTKDESDAETIQSDASEPPRDEADQLQRELETMTARLKASSLAVHEKLQQQSRAIEKLDDATAQNQSAVAKKRTSLDVRSAARTRTLVQALVALVAVVASFLGTYVFIAVFPKHR